MGCRCAPGGHDWLLHFLDTFLHLFDVTTGTINSARILNLYAFDREFNSTPFHKQQLQQMFTP